jgi:hypothetical protein
MLNCLEDVELLGKYQDVVNMLGCWKDGRIALLRMKMPF